MKKNIKDNQGFVLLYTILVASLVLLFALGVVNTAYKEAILSSSARDAGYSFFAADSGAECGLYLAQAGGQSCFGGQVASIPFSFNIDSKYCVEVIQPQSNVIESRGYNVDCNNKNSPRSVERAIRVSY